MTESTAEGTVADAEPDPERYVHSAGLAETAASLVDGAYAAAARSWDVSDHLRARATESGQAPNSPLTQELVHAVSYKLRPQVGNRPGRRLAPSTETEVYVWPPHIRDVDGDVVALWRDVAVLVQHPAAVARFHDLLFERRDGQAYDHAVKAVNGYLASAAPHDRADLDVVGFLVRAWELGRSVGAWGFVADACRELARLSATEISLGPARPGVLMPMLAALAAPPAPRQVSKAPETVPDPAGADQLLEDAFAAFGSDGDQAGQIASLMRTRTKDAAKIEEIDRREVSAHLAQAAATTGMARQMHLQAAIRIATNRGLGDIARQATADLQAIPVKDLGLRQQSWSLRVLPDQIERFLDGFTASSDWRDGLGFFLRTDCPTGDITRLRQEARDIARVAMFRATIPVTILGGDGLPRWTAQSSQDREAELVASCARIGAEGQGRLLAEGLRRMADQYGTPSQEELSVFLSHDGQTDFAMASSLGKGLAHFWNGDYEACVHVVVPKVETAARALLRELDEGIYRLQVAKDPGQYPGLFGLLQELEKLALDESWAYFLRWLFLGPPGMNIRNDVAHGFIAEISPVYAALVLRAAAMLITVTAPQPPSAARAAGHPRDAAVDLAELSRRDRDDILGFLLTPVPDPVPSPGLSGPLGRATVIAATGLRLAAGAFQGIARRLDP